MSTVPSEHHARTKNAYRAVPPFSAMNKKYPAIGPPSKLKKEDLIRIGRRYPTSQFFQMCLPTTSEDSPSRVKDGLAVFEASFRAGLRFPLPEFGMSFLREHMLTPGQLHPNAWSILVGFSVLCMMRDVIPTPSLFALFFMVRKNQSKSNCFTIQRVPNVPELIDELPRKLHNYEENWIIVQPIGEWLAPFSWCWEYERQTITGHGRPSALRSQYTTEIRKLSPSSTPEPVGLPQLLVKSNIAAAGWGLPLDHLNNFPVDALTTEEVTEAAAISVAVEDATNAPPKDATNIPAEDASEDTGDDDEQVASENSSSSDSSINSSMSDHGDSCDVFPEEGVIPQSDLSQETSLPPSQGD